MIFAVDLPRTRRDIDTSKKSAPSDMLLVQSIQITDKFGFKQDKQESGDYYDGNETTFTANEEGHGFCVNAIGKLIKIDSARGNSSDRSHKSPF